MIIVQLNYLGFSYATEASSSIAQAPVQKNEITILKNVSDLETIILPGDLVLFDIDDTILKMGKEGHIILNLDPKVAPLIDNWRKNYPPSEKKNQIQVAFLTARPSGYEQETRKQLTELGFPKDIDIIFAPNRHEISEKIPTKGKELLSYLKQSSQLPKRIIMVDDLKLNLVDVKNALSQDENSNKIPLKLFQRLPRHKLYESVDNGMIFPATLDHLIWTENRIGGSGGVHILQDKTTGQKYTFKCVLDPLQMKEEITADNLYRALGIPVPAFAIYESLPNIPALNKACQGPGPYRLATFIDREEHPKEGYQEQEMKKNFVADAFMGNWDIVVDNFKNIVLDKNGVLWRIDNGGSLRYHAKGDKKDPKALLQVSDLETMRNPQFNQDGSRVYKSLTNEDLRAQAQNIYNKKHKLFKTIDQLNQAIHLDNPHELKEIIHRRLDDLVKRFKLENLTQPHKSSLTEADDEDTPDHLKSKRIPYEKATNLSPTYLTPILKSGAGVLVYSTDPVTNKPVILIGKRIRHNWWSNFGGISDTDKGNQSDKTLADTAVREVQEESFGLVTFTPQELAKRPSHDITNKMHNVLYRMYIAPHPYIDTNRLKTAERSAEARDNATKYHWEAEYTDYMWMPIEKLLSGLETGTLITEENSTTLQIDDIILYPPFWEMLKEPEVRGVLRQIVSGKKNIPARHTTREATSTAPLSLEEVKQRISERTTEHGTLIGELKEQNKLMKSVDTKREQILPHKKGIYYNIDEQIRLYDRETDELQGNLKLSEPPSCEEQQQRYKNLKQYYEDLSNTPLETIESNLAKANEAASQPDIKILTPEKREKIFYEKMLSAKKTLKPDQIRAKIEEIKDRITHQGQEGYQCISENSAAIQESDSQKIQSMAGYLPDDQAEIIRKELFQTPLTQTQGYLAYRMGEEKFKELGGHSEKEVLTFLEGYSNYKNKMENASNNFKQSLIAALEEEKTPQNRHKIIFYHAADALSSFLYDLLSAFRAQFKMVSPEKFITFRGIDSSFATIHDVEAFIQTYKNSQGEISPYQTINGLTYADMGLSVNPFLFGNDGTDLSCSYNLFYTMKSVDPVDIEKFVDSFMEKAGIPGKYKNYKAIYEQYYRHNNQDNAKLFQIFIDPQVVDTVAFTAVYNGNTTALFEFVLNNQPPYHGFAKTMPEERTSPLKFNEQMETASTLKGFKMNDLQGRLYLKPEIFHNPKYVTIKSYWHHEVTPEREKSYFQKLNAQVSEDLNLWLQQQETSDISIFSEETPALKRLYKHLYEGVTGLKYAEKEAKTLFLTAISRGDIEMIQKILAQNPQIDINEKFKNMNYRSKSEPAYLSLIDIIPLNLPDSYKILKLLVEKGLDLEMLDQNNRTLFDKVIRFGNEEMINFTMDTYKQNKDLFQKVLQQKNTLGDTPLSGAILIGNINKVKKLIDIYKEYPTILEEALRDEEIIDRIIENQNTALLNIVLDAYRFLIQHIENYMPPLDRAIYGRKPEILEIFLNLYADQKEKLKETWFKGNQYGNSPLTEAIRSENIRMINILLDFFQPDQQTIKKIFAGYLYHPFSNSIRSRDSDKLQAFLTIAQKYNFLEDVLEHDFGYNFNLFDLCSNDRPLMEKLRLFYPNYNYEFVNMFKRNEDNKITTTFNSAVDKNDPQMVKLIIDSCYKHNKVSLLKKLLFPTYVLNVAINDEKKEVLAILLDEYKKHPEAILNSLKDEGIKANKIVTSTEEIADFDIMEILFNFYVDNFANEQLIKESFSNVLQNSASSGYLKGVETIIKSCARNKPLLTFILSTKNTMNNTPVEAAQKGLRENPDNKIDYEEIIKILKAAEKQP